MKYRVIPALILVPGHVSENEALDLAGHMQYHARRCSEGFGGRLMLDDNRNDGFVEVPDEDEAPYTVDDARIVWPNGKGGNK